MKFCVINEESTIRINFDYFGTLSTSYLPPSLSSPFSLNRYIDGAYE